MDLLGVLARPTPPAPGRTRFDLSEEQWRAEVEQLWAALYRRCSGFRATQLKQRLEAHQVLAAIHAIARQPVGTLGLLQANTAGSTWAARTQPVIGFLSCAHAITARLGHKTSYHGQLAGPDVFKEFRGFQRTGLGRDALDAWGADKYAVSITKRAARKVPRVHQTAHWRTFELS